ncbi:hypothetical protein O3P69_008835 [Scylla paramamosain]|uniref:Uncharacterized protein n=1 Tax=Scylla paramamosain TaxID=85552 RepID=A0AAW0TRZ4_SCYPA
MRLSCPERSSPTRGHGSKAMKKYVAAFLAAVKTAKLSEGCGSGDPAAECQWPPRSPHQPHPYWKDSHRSCRRAPPHYQRGWSRIPHNVIPVLSRYEILFET